MHEFNDSRDFLLKKVWFAKKNLCQTFSFVRSVSCVGRGDGRRDVGQKTTNLTDWLPVRVGDDIAITNVDAVRDYEELASEGPFVRIDEGVMSATEPMPPKA